MTVPIPPGWTSTGLAVRAQFECLPPAGTSSFSELFVQESEGLAGADNAVHVVHPDTRNPELGPTLETRNPNNDAQSPQRALPTETKVENGTSQRKQPNGGVACQVFKTASVLPAGNVLRVEGLLPRTRHLPPYTLYPQPRNPRLKPLARNPKPGTPRP